MNKDIILKTNNLSKKFHHRWAVSNLSLEVERGQIFGFLGPNGAGKSTTIRMILTLLKPTTGTYELFRVNPLQKGKSIFKKVGALIEEPSFYLYLSGLKNLEILGKLSWNTSPGQIEDALRIVGLKGRENDKVKNYSHGMRQRLGIAQAILSNPELIILDEPTSGLDPEGIKEIRELIVNLAEEYKITIFLSSHLLHEIEQVCTHMAIIDNGTCIVQGDVHNLLRETDFFVTELQVNEPQEAMEKLQNEVWAKKMSIQKNKLKVHVSPDDRPKLVSFLVENNFQISSVIPRTSLEDYYLSLIEHRSKQ